MPKIEQKTFAQWLAILSGFYDKTLTEIKAQAYWSILQDYGLPELEQAVALYRRHPKRGRFMPEPCELLAYLGADPDLLSEAAWDKAHKAIMRPGPYASVVFDDPIVHNVIYQMGGWILFCQLTDKNKPFCRQEFERRYQRNWQWPPQRYPNKLIGICEHQNQLSGRRHGELVLLGDPELAHKVLLQGQPAERLAAPPVVLLEGDAYVAPI